MKKILLVSIFSIFFITLNAQEKYPVYCDVYFFGERELMKNAVIGFDFGFDRLVDLLDENGKKMKFPSVFTAVNFLAKKGWRLFSVTSGTNDTMAILETHVMKSTKLVIHYIMTKDVSSDDEILNGLQTSLKERKEKNKKQMSDDGYLY